MRTPRHEPLRRPGRKVASLDAIRDFEVTGRHGSFAKAAREIIQTEAEVANRALERVDAENRLSLANAALVSILDIDEATRVHPAEQTLSAEPSRPDVERSIESALAHRSDYLRGLMNVEIARIGLDQARNNRLWDLSLDATVARGAAQGRDYAIGLALSIPLGDRSSELTELSARNGLRDAEIGLVELKQSIRIEVRQAAHGVEVGARRIELARTSRALAEQTVEIEQAKLAQGLTSTFRLTAVEDDLVRAQNRELDANIAYLNALSALDRTLGTTLARWNIDIEDHRPHTIRMNSERAPSSATSRARRGETAYEPPQRSVETVNRILTPGRGGEKASTRSLLLSLRELEHGQAIARSGATSAANTARRAPGGRGRDAPHDGARHTAGASIAPVRETMTLQISDFDAARLEQ